MLELASAVAAMERIRMASEPGTGAPRIPLVISKNLRSLAHDLSNSIETIMQASYLLSQAKLDDTNKKWVELIDNASRDAARINREIREILRSQSETS
jgi:signal transduction histidine kinase